MQRSKPAPLGYVVLDEGRPLRRMQDGYSNWHSQTYPIAVFRSLKVARRVRLMTYQIHAHQCCSFNPGLGGDEKRCFDLWLKRANEVRIRRVEFDAPTCAQIAAIKKARTA